MALLQVDRLSKSYPQHHAVQDLSFSVEEGQCVALLGPNGAGKTTTINMLTGLIKPTSGQIHLYQQGVKVEDRRPYIGYLPQMPSFYPWMTGVEFVCHAGQLSGLTRKKAEQSAAEWLDRVGLGEASRRKIGGYSGGMKQRLGFAQALIHRPKLLILDEPVSALDPVGRRDVLRLLRELQQEMTILFSTHVLHDAEEICDQILMMRDGQIAIEGQLDEIRNRYSEPVITIEAGNASHPQVKAWLTELLRKPYVLHSELQRESVTLTVSDLELAEREIWKDALQHRIFIRRFEAGQSTLEDLFLKVVQS